MTTFAVDRARWTPPRMPYRTPPRSTLRPQNRTTAARRSGASITLSPARR